MTIESQVFKGFASLIPPNIQTLITAVSGGADSMALALLAHEYATANGLKVITVTIDHKLRPESSDEAIWVHQTLSNFGIAHQTLVWNHDGAPNRLHEKAREARYQLLLDFCKNYENSALLTAHHQQDQVETIIMRFLKGSGAAGFKGIQQICLQQGIPIVRPLLEIDPKDLRNFLMEKNIAWVEDPSNDNPKYERTRVRALMQHINKDWGVGGILASASKIVETQSSLDEVIAEYEKRFIVMDPLFQGDDKENHHFVSSASLSAIPESYPVIPAKAGIHSFCHSRVPSCHSRESGNPCLCDMDPHFHGDDNEKNHFVIPALPFVIPAKAGIHKHEPTLSLPQKLESTITINQTEFFKCPTQIQRQWLRHKIWQIGGANYPKSYKTIDAILKMLRQPRVNNYMVAGCEISVIKKRCYLSKNPSRKKGLY